MKRMEKLCKDVIFLLSKDLDIQSLINFSRTNKKIARKIGEEVWKYKLETEFPHLYFSLVLEVSTFKEKYKILFQLTSLQEKVGEEDIYGLYMDDYSLDISDKGLKEIPKEIGILVNLKELYSDVHKLDLYPNKIENIPKEIGNLKNLVSLSIIDGKFKTIPKEIGNLKNLKFLELSFNKLISLPEEINKLEKLEELHLCNNLLTEIPNLENLVNLKLIDISHNKIENIKVNRNTVII